ncbi:MAG: pre-peptidase C-terminal domain-containing protein [Armatimonadetes bacterium]|nr:pre-peptidase C-terminal domain-containing protein [Armatimonadota bacterium]
MIKSGLLALLFSLVALPSLAILTEQEPNNNPSEAQTITPVGSFYTDFGDFALDPMGDRDWFKVPLLAGQQITIVTDGLSCGDTDTVVSIINPAGDRVLALNDDGGPGLGSQTVFAATSPGEYYVAITGFHGVADQDTVEYYTSDHFEEGCYIFTITVEPAPLSINLTDGETGFRMGVNSISLPSNRTGTGAGSGDYNNGLDHLFQHWYWYRPQGATREFALTALSGGTLVAPNEVVLTYTEPEGITFDGRWYLKQMGIDPVTTLPRSYVEIWMQATNTTGSPMSLDLFTYTDMDMDNTPSDDTAELASPTWMRIGGFTRAGFHTNAPPNRWQIGAYPTIRGNLTNTTVENLTNSGSPFGPGDFTGAFQNTWTLDPGASAMVGFVLALNMGLPGDANLDGCVDDTDLALVLALFGLSTDDDDYDPNADFNLDGVIDDSDLAIVLGFFGYGC